MADELGNAPPARVNLAAGLATHPGNIQEFAGVLADGVGKVAFSAASKALETAQVSIADMSEALRLSVSALPQHRVMGLDGKVGPSVPDELKGQVVAAMSQSFHRGAKTIDDANRIIAEAETAIEGRINGALVNQRRNEASVAAVASQIRDLVRGMPAAERIAFLRQRTIDKDLEVVSAVFSASPFISGITREQLADLKADAEATFAPAEVAQRTALQAMRGRLATASGAYLAKYNELVPRANPRAAAGAVALEKLRSGKAA